MVNVLSMLISSLFILYPNSQVQHTADDFSSFGSIAFSYSFEGYLSHSSDSFDMYYVDDNNGVYPMLHSSITYDSAEQDCYVNFETFDNTFNLNVEIVCYGTESAVAQSQVMKLYTASNISLVFDMSQSLFEDELFNLTFNFVQVDYYVINNDAEASYQQGRQDGYNAGYSQAVQDRDSYWRDQLRIDTANARTEGYNQGYQDGQNSAVADYGFSRLFLSIADTPVLMFRRLFDFSLFGTSVLSVILSLFTCLIVIHLVKKVLK